MGADIISGLILAWGLFWVVATLVVSSRVKPRPSSRKVALGVLHGVVWLVIGGWLLAQALSPVVPLLFVLVAPAAVVVVINLLGSPRELAPAR